MKAYKVIDFAFRQSVSSDQDFYLEIYRPQTNALKYTRYIQVDNEHPMNKKELKQLADFIYRFIGEPHEQR